MNHINTFANAHNRGIDWTKIPHAEWENVPDAWIDPTQIVPSQEVKNGNEVLLLRTHKFHTNPDLRTESDEIVHASCALIIPNALSIKRYDARKTYGGENRFAFVTTYRANSDQTFYKDEQLDIAHKEGVQGIDIKNISKFNKNAAGHFETDAKRCERVGIYIVTLPEDSSAPMNPKPVQESSMKILRIDNKPEIMKALDETLALFTQKKTPAPPPQHRPPH